MPTPTPSTGKARANHAKARLKRANARQHPVSVGQVGGTPPVSEDALQKAMFTEAQRTGALALKRAKAIMSTDSERIQHGKSE